MPLGHLLLLIALVIGLLLIAALLSRKDNRQANRLLCVILAAGLYFQYIQALKITGDFAGHPFLWRSGFAVRLLIPALFYLYILAMTVPGFQWTKRHLYHLLPFCFGVIWCLVYRVDPRVSLIERYFRTVINVSVSGIYLYACLRKIHDFREQIKSYFSQLRRVRLQWLQLLLILFVLPWLVGVADVLSGPYITMERVVVPMVTVIILLIGFFGLRQSVIFSSEDYWQPPPEERAELIQLVPKAKELLFFTEEELVWWKEKLKKYVAEQKPYLDPELRLTDLAKGLELKSYQVSEILNRGMGVSFYDYINQFRIEEAKRRLLDASFAHMNILGIATDSGFNSKSVFNETFRKYTGTTPSSFRSEHTLPSARVSS
jgi:AraC-like DNA-binding protein